MRYRLELLNLDMHILHHSTLFRQKTMIIKETENITKLVVNFEGVNIKIQNLYMYNFFFSS